MTKRKKAQRPPREVVFQETGAPAGSGCGAVPAAMELDAGVAGAEDEYPYKGNRAMYYQHREASGATDRVRRRHYGAWVYAAVHKCFFDLIQNLVVREFVGLRVVARGHATRFASGSIPAALVGVGRADCSREPVPLTSAVRDFGLASAQAIAVSSNYMPELAVFVIKKNPSILQNLLDWPRAYTRNAWASSMRWRARSTARRHASRLSSQLRPLRSLGIPARICPALTRERLGSSLGLAAEGIVDATSARIPTMNTRWRDWGTACSSLRTT